MIYLRVSTSRQAELKKALDLVENCQAAYQKAADDLRREWSQFAFVKVGVVVDGPPKVELTPAVETIVREGRRTYRRDAASPDLLRRTIRDRRSSFLLAGVRTTNLWWALRDSNPRPLRCKRSALTS